MSVVVTLVVYTKTSCSTPTGTITVVKEHFGGSGFPLSELGIDTTYSIYAGFLAILANLVVCAVATLPPTRVTRGCATSRR